jgi:hypothetical protein
MKIRAIVAWVFILGMVFPWILFSIRIKDFGEDWILPLGTIASFVYLPFVFIEHSYKIVINEKSNWWQKSNLAFFPVAWLFSCINLYFLIGWISFGGI